MKIVNQRKYRCRASVDLIAGNDSGMLWQRQADDDQQQNESADCD
jgi:hypothetical protein